jgi:methionine sulfoxide reductase catalytic subunit
MLIKKPADLKYSDVTPKQTYWNRRNFIFGLTLAGGLAYSQRGLLNLLLPHSPILGMTKLNVASKSPLSTTEPATKYYDFTHYNNYYVLGTDKSDPARHPTWLRTSPWTVSVEGEAKNHFKLSMDDILKVAPLEERIYRHRCVEGWSIVVPWIGYSLNEIVKRAEPTPRARYVAFESFYDSSTMLRPSQAGIQFPYVEGLRLDEAMHPLALLCVGMFGETLPNQDGAPVRIVLPWKYGFKSIKSIVKIRFVKDQPSTTWNDANAPYYGFYSNVNPNADQGGSQASERRLGEFRRRPTLIFNGYADQVASLYSGMDLKKYY